jgi:hypothetical protein
LLRFVPQPCIPRKGQMIGRQFQNWYLTFHFNVILITVRQNLFFETKTA